MHLPPLPSAPGRKKPERRIVEVINEFQSDLTEIDRRSEPLLARSTLYLLLAMVISMVIWAAFATLDKVVVARAAIETSVPKIVVQPLETAIVKSINVQPGDLVRAGQPLAALDPTFIRADADQVRNRILSLEAQIDRLDAERAGQPFNPPRDHPGWAYYQLQKSLYDERRMKFNSHVRTLDEKISQMGSVIQRRDHNMRMLASQLEVSRQVEGMRNELMKQETGSRLNYLMAQSQRLEIERNVDAERNALAESRHELESAQSERETFIRGWEADLLKELATLKADRDALNEQLSKAQKRSDLVVLQSPQDGVVLDIAQRSVGSVVREAEPFIRLVPVDAPLEVVAYVEARYIGTIHSGDAVEMKLDAFPYMEHGILRGVLLSISADSFTGREAPPPGIDPAQITMGSTFYKARVEITENNLINLPEQFRLVPGMTLSAEIKVGRRSVMSYLMRPIYKGFDEGMREP